MKRTVFRSARLATLAGVLVCSCWAEPELLTWDELVTLYQQDTPPAPLAAKLHALLTTPFVSNSASEAVESAAKSDYPNLRSFRQELIAEREWLQRNRPAVQGEYSRKLSFAIKGSVSK